MEPSRSTLGVSRSVPNIAVQPMSYLETREEHQLGINGGRKEAIQEVHPGNEMSLKWPYVSSYPYP